MQKRDVCFARQYEYTHDVLVEILLLLGTCVSVPLHIGKGAFSSVHVPLLK